MEDLNKFRGSFKVGDVFQGVFTYETIAGKWNKPPKANNNMLQLRRNHTSIVVNTDLVIHGGIDENGKLLDTSYSLCLK